MPVVYVGAAAVAAGPARLSQLIFRPRVAELLGNTIALVAVVVPACVVLGTAAALLVERTRVPQFVAVAFVAPLAVPAFVSSYAWATVWPSISGLAGASLVATCSYFPFVYLPALATLRRTDPALEESASALGLRPGAVVVRVLLPQLRLPVLGGALLVALHLLAEYGAFAYVRFQTFTTAVYDQFSSTFAGPAAASLAGVLVLLSLAVLGGEASVRGRQRHARIGSGAARPARRVSLGAWTVLVALAVAVVVGACLGVPGWALAHWLGLGTPPSAELWRALVTTLAYAAAGSVVTCLAALPVATLSVRSGTRLARAIESITFVCASLPGIVIGLSFVATAIALAPPVYQTAVLLVLAYVVLVLPRAVTTLRSGLAQVPPSLAESARALGLPKWRAGVRVTLPLLVPAMAAATSMAFLGIAGELTATLMLSPTGTSTLATTFWSLTSELDYPGAAPYALALVALSIPMTVILFRQSRRGTT